MFSQIPPQSARSALTPHRRAGPAVPPSSPVAEFRFPAARAARTASRNRRCRARPRGGATRRDGGTGGEVTPGGRGKPGPNPGPAVTQGQECAGTSSSPAGKIHPRWENPPGHLDADALTAGGAPAPSLSATPKTTPKTKQPTTKNPEHPFSLSGAEPHSGAG